MGTFGITDFNSSSALCKDGTIDKNNPSNPCINNGGVNWGGGFDWTKYGNIIPRATQTPVLCKDGTTDFTLSSPNVKYDNSKVCANNGGIAENQSISVKPTTKDVKQQNLQLEKIGDVLTAEDKFYEMLGIKKTSGGWGIDSRNQGRFLVAVVLVVGYFAYKKFKK